MELQDELLSDCYCPITLEVMTDPAVTSDGHSYERSAIQLHLERSSESPLTGKPLLSTELVPNHALRNTIQALTTETAEWKCKISQLHQAHDSAEQSLSAAAEEANVDRIKMDERVAELTSLLEDTMQCETEASRELQTAQSASATAKHALSIYKRENKQFAASAELELKSAHADAAAAVARCQALQEDMRSCESLYSAAQIEVDTMRQELEQHKANAEEQIQSASETAAEAAYADAMLLEQAKMMQLETQVNEELTAAHNATCAAEEAAGGLQLKLNEQQEASHSELHALRIQMEHNTAAARTAAARDTAAIMQAELDQVQQAASLQLQNAKEETAAIKAVLSGLKQETKQWKQSMEHETNKAMQARDLAYAHEVAAVGDADKARQELQQCRENYHNAAVASYGLKVPQLQETCSQDVGETPTDESSHFCRVKQSMNSQLTNSQDSLRDSDYSDDEDRSKKLLKAQEEQIKQLETDKQTINKQVTLLTEQLKVQVQAGKDVQQGAQQSCTPSGAKLEILRKRKDTIINPGEIKQQKGNIEAMSGTSQSADEPNKLGVDVVMFLSEFCKVAVMIILYELVKCRI